MKKKETITIKVKTVKLKIGIAMIAFIVLCMLLEFTPLMKFYWIKFGLERISYNKWNILFIAIVLIVLYFVEKRMFMAKKNEIMKGDSNNV